METKRRATMKISPRIILLLFLAAVCAVSSAQAYDFLLEKGEYSVGIRPLFGFGNPDGLTGETPYFYAGIFEFKYAAWRKLEVFASYEAYNIGTDFAENYPKLGLTFFISKKSGFNMSIKAVSLLSQNSTTPYTVTGELAFKGKLF
jgi:hypothetical protein